MARCIAPHEIQAGDLVAYLEGAAPASVVEHIARCPACAAEAASLRLADSLLSLALRPENLPAVEPVRPPLPPGSKATPHRPIDPGRPGRGLFRRMALVAIPACLLLAALAGIYAAAGRDLAGPGQGRSGVAATGAPVETAAAAQARPPGTVGAGAGKRAGRQGEALSIPAAENPLAIAPPRSLRELLAQQDEWSRSVAAPAAAEHKNWQERMVMGPAGQVYAVRADNRAGQGTIYFSYSADRGQTWHAEVQIDRQAQGIFNPDLVADDREGNLYVVWRGGQTRDASIYFALSTDGGQTWGKGARLNDTVRPTFNPSLAVDVKGQLYVAWQNRDNAITEVYLTRSPDGGQTWSKERRMARLASVGS